MVRNVDDWEVMKKMANPKTKEAEFKLFLKYLKYYDNCSLDEQQEVKPANNEPVQEPTAVKPPVVIKDTSGQKEPPMQNPSVAKTVPVKSKRPNANAPPGTKWCPRCKTFKSKETEFYRNKHGILSGYCRDCVAQHFEDVKRKKAEKMNKASSVDSGKTRPLEIYDSTAH